MAATPGFLTDHAQIEIDRDFFLKRTMDAAKLKKFRDYANGKHDVIMSDGQKEILKGILGNEFADNVCHQIIAEDADRMELTGYEVSDDAVSEFLSTEVFTKNALHATSSEVHYDLVRDGNTAVGVTWSNEQQRVLIFEEPWWNGDVGVFVGYDSQHQPLYAVKEWLESDGATQVRRRDVWLEDRLERFHSGIGTGDWQAFNVEGDQRLADGIVPWVKSDGKPLHIPIIHFQNGGRGRGNYGMSELAGGVLGFQDRINDKQNDISCASRMTGYQQLWMAGREPVNDPRTGEEINPDNRPGSVWWSENPQFRVGSIPAGDLSQLISALMNDLKSVSRMTRTPLHSITGGDWPSGEALYRAELPLIKKVGRQTKKVTPAWVTVAHRATEIANVYGRAGLNEDAIIEATFSDPNTNDDYTKANAEKAFWDAANAAVTAGLPLEIYLKRQGWTREDLADIGTAKLAEIALQQEDVTTGIQQ